MVEALCAKSVGLRKGVVEMTKVARIGERGHLVSHDFRLGAQHGFAQGLRVESGHHNRRRPNSPQRVRL
jgi:hypothetical protein